MVLKLPEGESIQMLLPSRKIAGVRNRLLAWNEEPTGFMDSFRKGEQGASWSRSGTVITDRGQMHVFASSSATSTMEAKQSTDGTLTFECKAKATWAWGNQFWLGFRKGEYYAMWTAINTLPVTKLRARCKNGAAVTQGAEVNLNTEQWYIFKIVITANNAAFYIDNVLQYNVSGGNVPDTANVKVEFKCAAGNSIDVIWSKFTIT